MYIYADVVFIINLIMDTLVFWIAGRLARTKVSFLRLLLGSAVSAGLYCALALVPFLRTYYNFFTSLAVLMLGLMVSFGPRTIGSMALLIIYANVSAFALGGAAFALFYYTNFGSVVSNALSLSLNSLPVKVLLAASAASYIVIKAFIIRFNNVTVKKQVYYVIKIFIGETETDITALVDTGNSLADPLTSEPVIIVEFGALRDLLPDDVLPLFCEHKEDELLELLTAFSKTSFIKRVRIIPFCSLGRQNGMLLGFKPDGVRIINQETADITTKDAIIGIYNYNLSPDGSFQALLNPSVL